MKSRIVLGGLLVIGLLAGCGVATPSSQQPASGTSEIAPASTAAPASATAASEAPTTVLTAPATAAATEQTSPATAETGAVRPGGPASQGGLGTRPLQVVKDYFAALAEDRAADAWALLSPELQAQSSQATLEGDAQALQSISVKAIEPLQVTQDRAVFHATIEVTPKPGATTAWNSGDNERWIELMFTPQGWQITQLASSPLAGG